MSLGYTEGQEKIGLALGLPINANLYKAISDACGGKRPMATIFDHLVNKYDPTPYVSNDGETRYRMTCPYHKCAEFKTYGFFSFTPRAGFCQDCREGSNLLNVALHLAKSSMAQSTVKVNEQPAGRGKPKSEKKGDDSIYLGAYNQYNRSYFGLNSDEKDIAEAYFVDKGLKIGYIRKYVMPYIDAQGVRYGYARLNYSGQRGLSILVPHIDHAKQRVRALKRRILPAGFGNAEVTAPKWNFNIYPRYPDALFCSEDATKAANVVLVENPLDAMILNLLNITSPSMKREIGDSSFIRETIVYASPICLTASDITFSTDHTNNAKLVLAYDCDGPGQKYQKRDLELLREKRNKGHEFKFKGDDTDSLLDYVIKNKVDMVDLLMTVY